MQRLKSTLKNASYNKYFFASFFILWSFYIIRFPTLSYRSEVWAEQGVSYLYHAYNSSLWQNIWMPDAGYLVWLPRFIALFTSYISSPFYFIYITNFIALAFIAYCVTFINHKGFRDILKSDIHRFGLSLILGFFILPYYEVLTYTNFTYFGFIFSALIIFMDKEEISTKGFWIYSILNALICISKFHFVVFIPVFLCAIVIHYYRKEKRSAQFYIPSIITMFIQIFYVLLVSSKTSSYLQSKTVMDQDIVTIILTSLKGVYFWLQAYAVNFELLNNAIIAYVIGLSLIAGLTFLLIKKWREKDLPHKTILLIVTFNILAIGYSAISCLSHLRDTPISFWMLDFRFSRICFMTYILIWLAGFILIFNLKNKILKNILLVLFMFLSINITIKKGGHASKPADIRYLASDWVNYHGLFDQEQYCIPINPFPLIISKNCSKVDEYNSIYQSIKTDKLYKARQKVLSLMINHPTEEEVFAIAYDQNGSKVGVAKMLSNKNRYYKYLLFNKSVIPYEIIIYNKQGQQILWIQNAEIYG